MDSVKWLILVESVGSDAFQLTVRTHEQVQQDGFNLSALLNTVYILPLGYNVWMFCEELCAVVPILNDESVRIMYELYGKHDSVVTIIARPIGQPPPDHCQAPSAAESLLQRRELSGIRFLRNVLVEPRYPCKPSDVEPQLREPFRQIVNPDKIEIDVGGGNMVAFPACVVLPWVQSEVQRGVLPTDVQVLTMTMSKEIPHRLTYDNWVNSLFRGPKGKRFLEIWNNSTQVRVERLQYLNKLYAKYPEAENNMRLLIHDLTSSDEDSEHRKDWIESIFLVDEAYFSSGAANAILNIPIDGKTLLAGIWRFIEMHRTTLCPRYGVIALLLRAFGWTWEENEAKVNLNTIELLLIEPEDEHVVVSSED